ncbi:MAG: hypothetical protein HOH91_05055 [Candidatus Marinimicrobia bacterium]|nr:hypothetical protein [Candidatus Neomarinimicrobiota bacterium]
MFNKKILMIGLVISTFFIPACIDSSKVDDDDTSTSIEIITDDLNISPHYVNLSIQSMDVQPYDIKFFFGPYFTDGVNYGGYFVGLNQGAVVKAALDSTHDFETAELPISWCTAADCPSYGNPGLLYDVYDEADEIDSTHYVIGADWSSLSTYGQVTEHSISSYDSTVYFIYTADYEWVKFAINWADQDSFSVQYALQNSDGTFGNTQEIIANGYGGGYYNYVYFDFDIGLLIKPSDWHVGFITSPVYSEELESLQYVPYVLFNSEIGVKVSVIDDIPFDELSEVPEAVTWLETPSDFITFGYEGSREVLVYHPEPPYNHKVIVENPEYVYLIDVGSTIYKLSFPNEDSYDSGILQYIFEEL